MSRSKSRSSKGRDACGGEPFKFHGSSFRCDGNFDLGIKLCFVYSIGSRWLPGKDNSRPTSFPSFDFCRGRRLPELLASSVDFDFIVETGGNEALIPVSELQGNIIRKSRPLPDEMQTHVLDKAW